MKENNLWNVFESFCFILQKLSEIFSFCLPFIIVFLKMSTVGPLGFSSRNMQFKQSKHTFFSWIKVNDLSRMDLLKCFRYFSQKLTIVSLNFMDLSYQPRTKQAKDVLKKRVRIDPHPFENILAYSNEIDSIVFKAFDKLPSLMFIDDSAIMAQQPKSS